MKYAFIMTGAIVWNWLRRQLFSDSEGNLSMGAIFMSSFAITTLILNTELIVPAFIIGSLGFLVQRTLVRVPEFSRFQYQPTMKRGQTYDHQ